MAVGMKLTLIKTGSYHEGGFPFKYVVLGISVVGIVTLMSNY